MTVKEDMRVRRTKQNIINAYVALSEEKNLDAITVQEIADRAMINRATFYAHYYDKQDLADQVFKQAVGIFTPLRNPLLFVSREVMFDQLEKTLTAVLEDCAAHRGILLLMIDKTPPRRLQAQLSPLLASNIGSILNEFGITERSEIPEELVLNYIVGIFTNVLSWWLHKGKERQMSAQKLTHLLIELALFGHLQVLGIDL